MFCIVLTHCPEFYAILAKQEKNLKKYILEESFVERYVPNLDQDHFLLYLCCMTFA